MRYHLQMATKARKGPVATCSRTKFNQVFKAELQKETKHYQTSPYNVQRHGGKVPQPERKNVVGRARARATAICGGQPLPGCPAAPVSIVRQRMDRGGYVDGVYFGTGAPLFRLYSDDGIIDEHMRAGDREGVKRALRAKCPGVRFTR